MCLTGVGDVNHESEEQDQKIIADTRSVSEMNQGFQLSDAMYFCRRGMEVIFVMFVPSPRQTLSQVIFFM